MPEAQYVLGHAGREIQRLMLQAAILRPITERLLREAGLRPGMRVLDVGCGAGDVAMAAAAMVGPSGSVVGIDRSAEVVATASGRAREAGLANVRFETGDAVSFRDPKPFDAVVGRCVVLHQADPPSFVRAAAGQARPGGVVAFHEIIAGEGVSATPEVPLWRRAGEWFSAAFRSSTPNWDAGRRMIEIFSAAGLPQPTIFCERPVGGGPDSLLYSWIAETVASLMPAISRLGIAGEEEVDVETLEGRLRDAVVSAHAQVVGPSQFCAWASV